MTDPIPMPVPIPPPDPQVVPGPQGYRSAAVARAWRAGITLARLLQQHDVPRPQRMRTSGNFRTDGVLAGMVEMNVRMASAADLLRLTRKADLPVTACVGAGDGGEQAYVTLANWPAQITAYWSGPVTASTDPQPPTPDPFPKICAECGTGFGVFRDMLTCPDCAKEFCGEDCLAEHGSLGVCPWAAPVTASAS